MLFRSSKNNVYSVTTNLNECFQWNSENGFAKNEKRNNELVLVGNIIYQKNNSKSVEVHNQFKSHYQVLSELDLSKCNQVANQLSKCKESYLIKIGYHSGGSIGWLGRFYIFGIFEDFDNNDYLVPLRIFNTQNQALNFMNYEK